jgi:hypothetical protein
MLNPKKPTANKAHKRFILNTLVSEIGKLEPSLFWAPPNSDPPNSSITVTKDYLCQAAQPRSMGLFQGRPPNEVGLLLILLSGTSKPIKLKPFFGDFFRRFGDC